jgi:hypothetical protein
MGIVPLSLEFLRKHIGLVGGFIGCRMLELGDQQMYSHMIIVEGSAAKFFFESIGVLHTSIDVNGQFGALPIDLSKPILNPEMEKAFDVVTDFGTSEHVGPKLEHLYECRLNCHRFCRPGGILLFMNPKTGHWPAHGYHYFSKLFYERIALAAGYGLLEISEHPTLGNTFDGWQVHAAFQRRLQDFPDFQEFSRICDGTLFHK